MVVTEGEVLDGWNGERRCIIIVTILPNSEIVTDSYASGPGIPSGGLVYPRRRVRGSTAGSVEPLCYIGSQACVMRPSSSSDFRDTKQLSHSLLYIIEFWHVELCFVMEAVAKGIRCDLHEFIESCLRTIRHH